MSVSIQTVEFERRDAYLSALDEGPPYTVHGVALGANDVTVGQSGIKKLWPADALRESAKSLEGRSLVVDHSNGSRGVVGQVTKAGYKENTGVIYEAELFDDDLAEKISNGLLEVSIRGKHTSVEQMEETDDGAKIVEDITFDNLSIVPTGAAPSNTIEIGETDELSMAELSAFTESLDSAELQEITPGMWVKTDDMKGITISQVQDGEIEVDVYEEQDGQWRSTEETEMFSVNELMPWDVDEDDIGPVEDSDESDEDDEEAAGISSVPDNLRFSTKEDAMTFIEDENILTGVHEMDGVYVPGDDHEEFIEWVRARREGNVGDDPLDSNSVLEESGDKVMWESSGGQAMGVVVDRKTDGCFNEEIDGDVEVCADEDDPVVLIEIVEDGERQDTMVAHKESTIESADFEMSKHKMDPEVDDDKESEQVDPPEFEEGMMVQWSVNPDMFGEVVHNPDDPDIIMVEVMEMMDGEMKSTGHTLTAAPPDLEPMNEETMSSSDELETFSDYPEAATENAQMALDARDETDNPNDCGTDVGWKRANQLASGEALSEDVVSRMASFNRHRQNADMDDDEGKTDCGWMMWKAWGGDEGIDWAMRKMDSMEENASIPLAGDEAELQAIHEPEWDDTTTGEWNEPALEDFTDESWEEMSDDMREEIANHFLVSKTGEFPPERFSDFALPVVDPDGNLNVNALANAKARAGQVETVSEEEEQQINQMIDMLANDNFEDASFGEDAEEADMDRNRPRTVDDTGSQGRREQSKRDRMPQGEASSINVLTGDDLRRMSGKSEESELDNATKVDTMTEEIEQKLAELSEPVAVEQSDLDELQEKADRFEEMSDTLSELKERTDVLDEADRDQVEELADAEDPVVVESTRMEQLEDEAQQVSDVYASALAEELEAFSAEELSDKFSIEELREKYEEQIGDPAEELATSEDAEPRSGDVEEEELEERGGSDDEQGDDTNEDVSQKQAELKEKILERNRQRTAER